MPDRSGPTPCRVLVRDVHPGLLHSLTELLLSGRADVELVRPGDGTPPEDVDLVVAGARSVDRVPRLVVAVNGTDTRLELTHGELSRHVLDLAVGAAAHRGPARAWYESLLEACGRFDHLLSEAVTAASAAYAAGGGYTEWTDALRAGRAGFGGPPMSGSRLDPSVLLDADPAAAVPDDCAAGRLIRDYDLRGRHVDVLLACLLSELDGRYGRRFAFLVGDSTVPGPTADALAALLCADAGDRLDFLADVTSGVLVTAGLVARGPAHVAVRNQAFALDRSVLRIFLEDGSTDPEDVLLDPTLTARASGAGPGGDLRTATDKGGLVHLHSGTEADRRSRALDVAAALGCRLLAVPWARFSGYDHLAAHRLRRDCLRLGVRCLAEGVPRAVDAELLRHLATARVVLSTGPAPLAPGGPARVRNLEVRPPTLPERRAVWAAAARWTGVAPTDGLDPLVTRFGTTVDRAVDVLTAAASAHASFTTADVAELLAQYTMDDAGGLLHALAPRACFDDLVLADETRRALIEARDRIAHRDLVVGRLGWDRTTDRLTGTYLLFAGPNGTGKTTAAEALAHELGLPVQQLEISALFSRWVGDFEEHVDRVFAAAQASGALLVVNEADAILGPRTQVVHGQDRYANAGTSHILSRLEQFRGHVVFTTNLLGTNNIDPAFHRRLTAVVRFPPPDTAGREELWRSVWPTGTRDGLDVDLRFDLGPQDRDGYFRELARAHPLSGGSIANVARSATFLAAARDPHTPTVTAADVERALSQELAKIGDFRSLMRPRARS